VDSAIDGSLGSSSLTVRGMAWILPRIQDVVLLAPTEFHHKSV